jgi:WD40 repeat protein
VEPTVLKHENRVAEVAISSDGKWAATYSVDLLIPGKPTRHLLRLWNLAEQTHRDLDLSSPHCQEIDFSPTARFLVADGVAGALVWDVASGRDLYSVEGHSPVVFSDDEKAIAYAANRRASPRGGVIASGCVLALAGATDGQPIRYLSEERRIAAIGFCHGHDYIAAGTGNMVRVWESDTGHEVSRIPHSEPVRHLAYSPAGRLMSVNDEGAIYFWRLGIDPIQAIDRLDGSITALAASPNGRYLTVIVGPELVVFDCDSSQTIERRRQAGRIRSIDIAEDGCFVFSTEPTVMLSASGREDIGASGFVIGSPGQAETWIQSNRTEALAISPTGEFVAMAGDFQIQLWNVRTLARCGGWNVSGAVKKLIFDPSGRYLAIIGPENLWLANVFGQPNAPHLLKTAGSTADVAYSRDGRCFVLHAAGRVSIWDADNKELINGFESGESVTNLFPGPGRDQVVLVGADHCVTWDLEAKKTSFSIRHEGLLAVSGDRHRIAILREQGRETWICNLVEENVEARFYCYRARFSKAAFIGNERVAVTDDGGMRIEPIRGDILEEDLSKRLCRHLTMDERERYLPDELSERSQV